MWGRDERGARESSCVPRFCRGRRLIASEARIWQRVRGLSEDVFEYFGDVRRATCDVRRATCDVERCIEGAKLSHISHDIRAAVSSGIAGQACLEWHKAVPVVRAPVSRIETANVTRLRVSDSRERGSSADQMQAAGKTILTDQRLAALGDDDPVTLKEASELLRGLVGIKALKAAARDGSLEAQQLGGRKVWTTTRRFLREWRERCRVAAQSKSSSARSARAMSSTTSKTANAESPQESLLAHLRSLSRRKRAASTFRGR